MDGINGVYAGPHPEHTANICGIWDGGQTYESCEANARLIAAAPDMLAALQDSEAAFAAVALTADTVENRNWAAEQRMIVLRAIRKATEKAVLL
jgi:hypothetical protein